MPDNSIASQFHWLARNVFSTQHSGLTYLVPSANSRFNKSIIRRWGIYRLLAIVIGVVGSASLADSAFAQTATAPSPLLGCPTAIGSSANNPCNWDVNNILWAIRNPHPDLVMLAAHRGTHALAGTTQAPNVPENSLQAVGLAAQEGWESIEIDVKLTQDNVPILSHDSTWGREWCGRAGFLGNTLYDPFIPPGSNAANDAANAVVGNTTLANTRSSLGQTWLRDSVNVVADLNNHGCAQSVASTVYPPTLQDMYTYIQLNGIQMVVALDIKDAATAAVAWDIVQRNQDSGGHPASSWTILKVPAVAFPTVDSYKTTFGATYTAVKFNPVFHTSGIAKPQAGAADVEEGDIPEPATISFGGEPAMNDWISRFESSPIDIVAIEVSMKDPVGTPNGAILSSVLAYARTNRVTQQPMTISQFHSVPEYYVNGDPAQGQYFRSGDGTCCYVPEFYLFNNKNHTGPTDPSLPYDHNDNRDSISFLLNMGGPNIGATMVTTDRPSDFTAYLQGVSKRDTNYMAYGGPPGFHYCASEGSACTFEAPGEMAYGPAQGPWYYENVGAANYACSSAAFGGDPAPGTTKFCYYQPRASGTSGGGTPPPPQQPQSPTAPSPGKFLNHAVLLGNVDSDPSWFQANIPFLEVPDPQIQQIYYYRWHTYKEHLVPVPSVGWVSTEFLGAPGYAAPYGGISAAAGHQIIEGRWLRDQQYVRGITEYWLNGPGQNYKPQNDSVNADTSDWAHEYSFWAGTAVWQTFLATGDAPFTTSLLDPLVKQYRGWDNHFNSQLGLYWQIPVWDATEYTPASFESSDPYHGGAGYRPMINSYQFGDAQAISHIASLASNSAYQSEYSGRATALQTAMHQHLWDSSRSFYYHMNRDNNPSNALLDTREEQGFLPWMFGAALPSDSVAMGQLLDPAGFATAYGPPTAEKRSRWYMYDASKGCCHWNGPSWPFETSQTLTGLANLLIDYPAQSTVNSNDYVNLLHTYAATQFNNGVPYVGQAHDPDTGNWIYEGTDYNHSSYVDNVISGFIGLRGQSDNSLVISPLAPPSWDYFALEDTPYHGHNVTLLWDRQGTRYGQGAGLSVFVDGKSVAHQATLGTVKVDVGAAILQPFTPSNTLQGTNGAYHIINVETGKLMGVEHEYPFDGAQIQQYEDNGSQDHAWAVEDAGGGNVKIRNIASNLVLGVDGESTVDSALIKQAHDNGTADHAWQLIIAANGAFQIRNGNSGLLLGVSGESSANSANIVQFHDNGTKDHLWMLVPVQDPRNAVVYKVVNANSSKALAIENGSQADGAQIQQFRDTGTPDQLWAFEDIGTHIYKIRNIFSSLVLGIAGESKADSALIKQALDNGTNDHLWTSVDPLNSRPQLIQSNYSSLVLGVDGESKADSANVVQFHDTGTPDHLWTVVPNFDPRTKPFYQIVNVETGKLLGIENESFNDSAQVQQYEDNGSKDHIWQLEEDGYNLFRIRSYYSNNVLGVDRESKVDNALIKVAVENGTPDHVWQFIDTGGGQFQIKNMNSGLLLGVSGESSINGANIVQFHDNGTRDHLWKVIVARPY